MSKQKDQIEQALSDIAELKQQVRTLAQAVAGLIELRSEQAGAEADPAK